MERNLHTYIGKCGVRKVIRSLFFSLHVKKKQLAESHGGRTVAPGRVQKIKMVEIFGNNLVWVDPKQQ